MKTVQLNGEPRHLANAHTVQDLITELALGNQRYAIEINGTLVPRSTYPEHPLEANDQIEIVQAIGGG